MKTSSNLPLRGEVDGSERSEETAGGGLPQQKLFLNASPAIDTRDNLSIMQHAAPSPHPPRFARRPPRVGGGKIVSVFAATALAFALSACGVKSDLVRPDGKPTTKDQRDPSRPPQPIGQ